MNRRAQIFQEYLQENNIDCFNAEEINDELNTTAFRSHMEIAGQRIPLVVILDDSIYGMLRLQIAPKALKEINKQAILEYINELNRQYKVFKYYVTTDGDLCLDCCILCEAEQANGPMVYTVMNVILTHLTEEYPVLMRKVWAE
ncbi:LktC [uncultured Sporomusa sp.]|uniref:LktC n=1 Tax=uncultured Sporomusa sp. TaxID=307249 RepID=A0A212LMW4_9FIRM|nr:YbjN domain-containing protein [uncultured Sporomusa sp.]SCM78868.1 LktC [uncultured Sporomusa sp.]